MRPTRRGFLLLSVAVALAIALHRWHPALGFLPDVTLLGVLAAAVLDGTRGVRRGAWSVVREVDRRLSVGAPARVVLTVRQAGGTATPIEVRDGAPPALHPERVRFEIDVPAGGEGSLSYALHPDRRGAFVFDHVWILVPGRLGLVTRTLRIPLRSETAVIPDIRALKSYDLLARRAMTEAAGIRALRRRGEGTEVESLREYVPGDSYRSIDWKATARRHSPVSRELEAERRRNVLFLVDAGRWMGQPANHLLKLDHALNAALLLSHVADRSGDLTAALAFSDRVLGFTPLGRGAAHQARLLDALHAIPVEPVEPDFDLACRFVLRSVRRRSLCILFSDFADPVTAGDLLRGLAVLARHHLVLCVHLRDPHLEALASLPPRSLYALNRRALAERQDAERKATLDRVRALGGHVLTCRADALTADVINRYLELKGRALV